MPDRSAVRQCKLDKLLAEVRACRACEAVLPFEPRPVLRASSSARLLIVGQAPGTRVHETGIPWNDPSGDRLRHWLGVEREFFYDERHIAIVPMGFCYPGRGKSGDLPPRPECAALWREQLLACLPDIELTLLIGHYAQQYHLPDAGRSTVTETVQRWREFLPDVIPTPHPSPRNQLWLRRNPWFEADLVPALQRRIREMFAGN
ncbi:uracil-DNA glycosylase family protein [Thiogranum longum]|uniref:uracil-DNA glycosylase family protein n=1 Tax=Thiogranum longum TaxID=1537524 RepID=UPI00104EA463|nr:uracil-DNA glycosylase family protein [Thiogranum longum]